METRRENTKGSIIQKIIDIEQKMFLEVKVREEEGSRACQEKPKTFRFMREISHCTLSEKTLKSYLKDLEKAVEQGRNLITEKYALMENLIPHPEEGEEYIHFISETEVGWMTDLKQRYPKIIQNNISAFVHYMMCEYETYSVETLRLLAEDIEKAVKDKVNWAEMRYTKLFEKIDYSSLAEANEKMKS